MNVELTPIPVEQSSVLRQLIDLYGYDLSDRFDLDVGEDGRYPFRDLAPYWQDPWRHPRFVRVDAKIAGFVLVHTRGYFPERPEVNDVAEFFVLKRYRRRGVGERAAIASFDAFPGPWQVRVRDVNTPAIAFWQRIIERYTGGKYREQSSSDPRWRGVVYDFEQAG